jgi:hypothetical protein
MMNNDRPLSEFPKAEQTKLRWILRHADRNGIVDAGVAYKFGRTWYINTEALPAFLVEQTRQAIGGRAA